MRINEGTMRINEGTIRKNEGWAEEQAIREAIMHYIFPVPEEEPEPEELLSLGPNRTRQKPPGTVVDEMEIQEYIRIEQEEKKMQERQHIFSKEILKRIR